MKEKLLIAFINSNVPKNLQHLIVWFTWWLTSTSWSEARFVPTIELEIDIAEWYNVELFNLILNKYNYKIVKPEFFHKNSYKVEIKWKFECASLCLPDWTKIKNLTLDALPLSDRTINALRKNGINTVDALFTFLPDELIKVKWIWMKWVDEINDSLKNIDSEHIPFVNKKTYL